MGQGKAPPEHCEEIICKSCKAKYFAFMAPGVGGRWGVTSVGLSDVFEKNFFSERLLVLVLYIFFMEGDGEGMREGGVGCFNLVHLNQY